MSHPGHVLPGSPLLDHCPPTLPACAYRDPDWLAAELAHVWKPSWVHVGRRADLAPGTIRPIELLGQRLILVNDETGVIRAFHNTCRHRGAELCAAEAPLRGRRILCPYHQWAYDTQGRLVSTAFATPTADFRKEEHGLFPVHLHEWRGFLFVCLGDTAPDFGGACDLGLGFLANWPLERLVRGHRKNVHIACNWKIFWENYNECLHCPGVHPSLSQRVPVYARGIMAPNEASDWIPSEPSAPSLSAGARSWTVSGAPCGPEFADLTEDERATGMNFLTFLPTMFIVAHVDYVRTVSVLPDGPEATRLSVDWLFAPETLAAPGFDISEAVDFPAQVLTEDAAACEMNQRGLASDRYRAGTLMPQEFEIARFHAWLRARLPAELGGTP
jgi:glycine betaine catabolism A